MRLITVVVMYFLKCSKAFPGENGSTISRIVSEFKEMCPYTNLCYSSSNLTFNDEFGFGTGVLHLPCCYSCYCEDKCNFECCPDKQVSAMTESEFLERKHTVLECIYPQFRPFDTLKYNALRSFTFVSRCPFGYTDLEVKSKCERDYVDFDFSDVNDKPSNILPLSSPKRQKTFKNYYCWLCDGELDHNVLPWNGALMCKIGYAFVKSFEEIPMVVESEDDCNLMFEVPDGLSFSPETCSMLVSRCNETGLWKTYDRFLEEACLSYLSPYDSVYRNVHCYLCNQNDKSEMQDLCEYDNTQTSPHSFIALLDFNNLDAPNSDQTNGKTNESITCDSNEKYDVLSASCVHLQCASGMVLKNESCVPLTQNAKFERGISRAYVEVDFNTVVVLSDIESATQASLDLVFTVNSVVFDFIRSKLNLIEGDASICDEGSHLRLKRPIEKVAEEMQNTSGQHFSSGIDYLAVYTILEVYDFADLNYLLDQIASMFTESSMLGQFRIVSHRIKSKLFNTDDFSLDTETENKIMNMSIDGFTKFLFSTGYNDPDNGKGIIPIRYMAQTQCKSTVLVEPAPFCAKLKLPDVLLVEFKECGVGASFKGSEMLFEHYIVSEEGDEIFVCWNEYKAQVEAVNKMPDRVSLAANNENTEMVILSVICMTFSLASLLITLIVYLLLPKLRTVPGLNNIMLVISLLIYQSLALTNSLTEISLQWICSVIGIVLHFSLLSGFFWMFFCTFHMARTFVMLTSNSVLSKGLSKFIWYFVFAETAPILCIGGVFAYASLASGNALLYGGSPCYIQDKKAVFYFVAAPMALVVCTNLLMFILVVVKIVRMPDMAKSGAHERKNVVIFAKLSTITGLTWSFGFIYQFTAVKLFAYLFVLFNASQGVFILFAFVINHRVFDMLQNLYKVHGKGIYLSNGNKDSTRTQTSQRTVTTVDTKF